jgi:hypothetical protein
MEIVLVIICAIAIMLFLGFIAKILLDDTRPLKHKLLFVLIVIGFIIAIIALMTLQTYYTNHGYSYQESKFQVGGIFLAVLFPVAIIANIYYKIKYRKRK